MSFTNYMVKERLFDVKPNKLNTSINSTSNTNKNMDCSCSCLNKERLNSPKLFDWYTKGKSVLGLNKAPKVEHFCDEHWHSITVSIVVLIVLLALTFMCMMMLGIVRICSCEDNSYNGIRGGYNRYSIY